MKTAVIIDDENLCCDLIKHLIHVNKLPIKIIGQANDGGEAITIISDLKPDIVFIDIQMPVYNGLQVMEAIQKMNVGVVNFIVITAYDYFEYAQYALRFGAKDILLKPIASKQFLNMIERVLGYKFTDNLLFNNIMEYINTNYEKSLSLNECANHFHISPNHIARLYKKYIGISFIKYLNDLRIKKAIELLKETDFSIKEIAQKVGYENLNYFYKNFNQIIGTTPKLFKENKSTDTSR